MGNSIAGGGHGKKKAKVMKLSGESFKLKTPISAVDVVKDYPGHVLLESESVKRFGIRAKPLELHEDLKPKKIYFLVELPKMPLPDEEGKLQMPKRASSALHHHMSAKDRLERLMLSRRSASDLSAMKQQISSMQVKVKLPRSQVQKIMAESKDEGELTDRIVHLCLNKTR